MTDNYLTNENISNNIMIPSTYYSLKERKIPNNNNNLAFYHLSTKGKPDSKFHKVNDHESYFRIKQEPTLAEEDIDYLKLFSQKNKNANNNPNNRIRKSKFYYSNRTNANKTQNRIQKPIQRAISSSLNQVPQKNNFEPAKNGIIYFSRRVSGKKENQNIKQSRYNSATERGTGNSKKIIGVNSRINIGSKEQIPSGNIGTNMNINLNIKKIPMPQKNGYNSNSRVNKVSKIKIDNNNNNKDKAKIRNKNNYYDENNYNVFNTSNGFYQNLNTNQNLSHQFTKQNSVSQYTNLGNFSIENKENIIPNHNNSYNYNTIVNNNIRKAKTPINMKLYRNSGKNLPNETSLTNYNPKSRVIPLSKLSEQYTYKLNPNHQTKFAHSIKSNENKNFYTINDIIDNKYKKKEGKNQGNLRQFIIKKNPQYNNTNFKSEMNIFANTEGNGIKYNYEEKENFFNNHYNSNTQTIHHQNKQNEHKNINKINNGYNPQEDIIFQKVENYYINEPKKAINVNSEINNVLNFDNYNENQLITELISESFNPNLYIPKAPNKVNDGKQYNEHTKNSKLTKIPIPQKIKNNQENINQDYTNINNIQEQNKQNNTHGYHFPNPEKPVRKDSISISEQNSSNVTYNVFDASGWLKNYAVLTNPGCDKTGNQKINQDSFVFKTDINGITNFNIFGVMDGHGPQGHFVSQFASKFIPFQIINHREIKSLKDPEEIYKKLRHNEYEIINRIFLETDNQLKKVNFDATESGSTCVLVIHIGSHIICANTGDSRAILISDALGENDTNDYFEAALSYDYKPEMPEEKQRIESCGGVVEQLKNKLGEGVGPYRVWAKEGGYPGLAMSRSIGDLVGKGLGVIPNPGILEFDLNKNAKFIVVASDGIWEFLSNENVRDIGKKYYKENNPNGFCHEIVKCSYKLWKNNGIVVDDITAIAAFF